MKLIVILEVTKMVASAFTHVELPCTELVLACTMVASAPPIFMVIPVDDAMLVSIVMLVELTNVARRHWAVIEPEPPEKKTMFPVIAEVKDAVALVIVVVPFATASVVEMLLPTVFLAFWMEKSVPVPAESNPPPFVFDPLVGRTSHTLVAGNAILSERQSGFTEPPIGASSDPVADSLYEPRSVAFAQSRE